jgi:hypothetical protein
MGVSSDPFCLTMGRYAEFWHRLEKSLITLWTFSLWCEIVQRNLIVKSGVKHHQTNKQENRTKTKKNGRLKEQCIISDLHLTVVLRSTIGTDCIGSCKSNYHTITATTVPVRFSIELTSWCLTYMYNVLKEQCIISDLHLTVVLRSTLINVTSKWVLVHPLTSEWYILLST